MKLKTIEDWQNSGCRTWDEYCKFGDLVDQEVAAYFLNIMLPRTMKIGYFQAGEPYSYARNPKDGKPSDTYATFVRYRKGIWQYRGSCWIGFTMPAEKFRKYDCLKDFLRETYELVDGVVQAVRPHIYCEDGFEMSVQAGDGLYSAPRENLESGEYTACEVGFPNRKEELLMPYAEDLKTPTESVYGYVPVEVIEQIIEKHGGWFDSRIPFAQGGGRDEEVYEEHEEVL